MARTYPLVILYNQCLGAMDNPCAFSSVCLENLRNGEREYLSTIEQLITALPKTEDPISRLALHAHITPTGHPRLRHSMRAALWWLLPSDGKFCRASHDLHYYLACQGRRVVLRGDNVTQPFYESRVNLVINPVPPASSCPVSEESTAPTPAHKMPPSGEEAQPSRCQKSRRRRRRKAARSATQRPASLPADVMTQADPTANSNSARWRATWPRSEANDRPEMRSTLVKHPLSFTSSPLSQPPISAANQNEERASCQDHSKNLGLYKLAPTDPRQDLTATQPKANNSGFGLSSPAPKHPYTKPFSGLPSRPKVTSPYREAGGTYGGRPGIMYPLLPHATPPDTKLLIDAATLPESAALGRQSRPPTVLDLEETREKENQPPSQSRRQPHKRRCNRSTGVYRPSKRSPPRGRWCD